ncbi:MAG: redoxin domain-containing protein [Oscillospiraceae bacterium]|nr:redoxin domain-containing protein [Oscillospiraceae bacterium]
MTVNKKRALLAACLVLAICLSCLMVSCRKQEAEGTKPTGASTTYTIELTTGSGMALEGVGIYIYTDDTLAELVWFAKTDAEGVITFTDAASDSYVAVLSGVPEGYPVEDHYPLTGEETRIVLGNEIIEVDDLEGITFELGDMICDYTFTAIDGKEYTISQLLQEKNAVVLNFWYLECAPCKAEFPYLQEAYEKYSDSVEVLALNPINDDVDAVAEFRKEQELTFPMALCDEKWQEAMQLTAYPTTVVIDRFGNIALIHKGSVTEAALFERILSYYGAEDYVQTIAKTVDDIPETEEEREARTIGTKENPIEFGGFSSYTVNVAPDEEVYMNIYKVTQLYVQIRDADAYVIYGGKTYKPSGGVVGLSIASQDVSTPVSLVVGNSGDEEKNFTLSFSLFKGTMGNPYAMSLGKFDAAVSAGNNQGVYFTYKATEAGTLAVRCLSATAGVDYDFTLYNLNTYALRNYQSEGRKDDTGARVVSIKVRAGDTIQFSAAAMPDSSGVYPAASFTFEAYMDTGVQEETEEEVEKIVYAVTLTDENRTPISGAQVYLKQADGSTLTLTTDESGLAAAKLEPGTYPVTVKIPAGYKARVTEFTLTEADPVISVKLDTDVVVTAVYTVRVLDMAGSPVSGVLVSVGGSYGYTDANGAISFTLTQGDYSAVIGAPSGYYLDSASVPFGSGTELVVTLKEDTGSGEEQPRQVDYAVKVTDFYGNVMTNATVTFLRDGATVGISPVDATGTAVMSLPAGSYTVALSFDSDIYRADASRLVLTETEPSGTVCVAVKQDGTYTESYVGELYHVTTGATYATLQSGVTNYFIFTPTEPGTYRFTTSDPSAVISYWGGSVYFISDMTGGTDYADNAFTLNIKERNIGVDCIIGVTGAEECFLLITRTGDAVLDESDIPAEVYEATTPPTAFKLTLSQGQSLTYVNVAGATADYTPVLGADGYYHLNSADGPILYVDLGPNAPYVSFYKMLGYEGHGGTSFTQVFRDENGGLVKKEDYTDCMCLYVEAIDSEGYGVYPMTEDLYYMLRQGGDYKGWWDSESPNYLFSSITNLNTEIAWMFCCCYVQ